MQAIEQRLANAVLAQQAGRLQEAEAVYREVLQERPHDPDVLHLLGLAAHQAGRHNEAIDLIRQALGLHGRYPLFHSNLAAVYLTVGRIVEASLHAREAIRLKPDLPDAHQNLGHALRRQGFLDDAAAAFAEALRLDPRNIDVRCQLGGLYQRRGRLTEAVAILREAVRLAPENSQARNSLGEALSVAGSPEEAISHLKESIRLRPNNHEAWNNLGYAQEMLLQHDEAIRSFREALRIDPRYGAARNNLAYALESVGKIEDSVTELEETLHRDPNDCRAYSALGRFVGNGRYQFPEEQVRHVQQLLQRRDLQLNDYYRLHQALTFHFDKANRTDEAFFHCSRSKDFRRAWDRQSGDIYDPAAQEDFVNRTIATCTPAWFEFVRSFGNFSELPIFIVGMMRSGTTLVEQVLASHPAVHGAGELMAISNLVTSLPERLKTSEQYPECLTQLDATSVASMAEEYLRVLHKVGGSALRVVDKMTFNFLRLGFIVALFPKAKIIHCVRDAADTCCSCYFQYFASSHPFTYDLKHLGHYYREYERLMAHWKRVLPVAMFDLQYEGLTSDPGGTTRKLLEFCGLEWDERCLRFHETERVVRTASALQVRKGMYRTSVGKWKRYEKHLKPLLEALGRDVAAAAE
jgi:tetratricopeptide (TPR) repeat protein